MAWLFTKLGNMTGEMQDYTDSVLRYLEYLGYPEYVVFFDERYVAAAIHGTVAEFYHNKMSFRLCALTIFSLTLNYQVMRKGETVH